MLENVLFLKKRKILVCIFIALVLSLYLTAAGVNFAQSPEEIEKMKSIQIINPHPAFSLRLWLDKDRGATFTPGERIKIFFQVSQDSFVRIYSYDSQGRVKIIFPNQYSPNNFVRARETKSIEGIIDPRSRPGIEYVQGFATTRPIRFSEKEENLISKEFMPEVSPDYKKHTQTIKGIIVSLPPTVWTSSNILSYTVRPITPPTTYGRIVATSHPQGAELYLDNVYRGTTPLNLDRITSGQHWIKFVMSGYQEWSSYISVSPSRTTTVSADLVPYPSYSSISVYSDPQGVKVYLDNTYKGVTPLFIEKISPGQYWVKLVKSGYQDWEKNITVSPALTRTISANLIPLPYGSISISCNQSGAKIFLDGTYKKASSTKPVVLEDVKEGYHELTIIKDGFRTWVEDVWVYTDETISIYVTMTRL